jgi:hypothetical protein
MQWEMFFGSWKYLITLADDVAKVTVYHPYVSSDFQIFVFIDYLNVCVDILFIIPILY